MSGAIIDTANRFKTISDNRKRESLGYIYKSVSACNRMKLVDSLSITRHGPEEYV